MARYRYSEHRRLYATSRWQRLRRKVFDRDSWRCQICGKAGRLECDHKKPITQGGTFWDPENLQTLCRVCHLEKTARERPGGKQRAAWRKFRDELLT